MPQFQAGESKTAKATMRNPTGKAFDYTGFLYMGTDLAVMAEVSFHLEAGEEKQVTFPVTMPSVQGTYPVHIGVFSGGQNIALYRATEDVVIAQPIGDFVYSDQVCGFRAATGSPSWLVATYSCKITNQGSSKGTRVVTFHCTYFNTYMNQMMAVYSESFTLTLEPGQSYTVTRCSEEWGSNSQLYGACARVTQWLEDNAGGSTVPCVEETGYW